MTKKSLSILLLLVLLFSAFLTACAPATEEPAAEEPAAEEPVVEETMAFKACQVTDVGGIDDKSFNATAWKGVEDAVAALGIEGKYLESQQQTDYEVNINAFLEEGCDLIISVGFLLGDATAAAAGANPDQNFAIVDVNYLEADNIYGSGFAINEATFLTGYLAAGMTQTGTVATFGGINIPPVTIFMDGFVLGVEAYNAAHGTDVNVLGWDVAAQDGLFVGNFESTDDGRTMGESLMDEGADIIMPVAGPVGAGTLAVIEERGSGWIVGVDNDWTVSFANQAEYVLASALKNMDLYVYETIGKALNGEFAGGNYLGTLENGGVGLGYGGVEVPAELQAEIEALIPQIIDGTIATLPAADAAPAEEAAMAEAMGVNLADLAGTTISFWHVWGTGAPGEGMAAVVDAFNATNEWGIVVEAVDQGRYNDAEDAMNAAIQSGDVPNAIVGYSNAIAGWYDVGVIADLQPYADDPAVGFTADEIADFYPGAYAGGLGVDGARIALPLSQSANVLFYNKTWAEELGFPEAPKTAAEFKEQACAAAAANASDDDPDNDGMGGLVLYTGASNIFSWLYAFGDDGLTEDGAAYDFTAPAVQEVAVFLKELWDEGCAFPTESYPNPEFATRKALFTMSSSAGIPYQVAAFEEVGSADEWVFAPFVGPDGQIALNAFGQYVAVVNTTPEQTLATWLFVKSFTAPEAQATWINASAYYPVRMSAEDLLKDYAAANPQWVSGLELLAYGHSEPAYASWTSVRRAVGDGFEVIIQGEAADIPMHLEELNTTAAELVAELQ